MVSDCGTSGSNSDCQSVKGLAKVTMTSWSSVPFLTEPMFWKPCVVETLNLVFLPLVAFHRK